MRPIGERLTFGRMTDKSTAGATPGLMHVPAPQQVRSVATGRGWMVFAGVMLLLGAAFNAVYGFAALLNDDYIAEESLLYGTVSVWGWLAIGFAVIEAIVALGLLAGSGYAALFGILIAGAGAVGHFMAVGGHPVVSVIVIAVDGLIIYGLCVHGFGREGP
jgi:hypothetical protein